MTALPQHCADPNQRLPVKCAPPKDRLPVKCATCPHCSPAPPYVYARCYGVSLCGWGGFIPEGRVALAYAGAGYDPVMGQWLCNYRRFCGTAHFILYNEEWDGDMWLTAYVYNRLSAVTFNLSLFAGNSLGGIWWAFSGDGATVAGGNRCLNRATAWNSVQCGGTTWGGGGRIEMNEPTGPDFTPPPEPPGLKPPMLAAGRELTKAVSDLAAARLTLCAKCDEWNGALCEKQFPSGKCLGGCLDWMNNPDSVCPLGLWGKE